MTVSPDDGFSSALSGIGPRLERVAACALGLVLALCLAGLAGLLALGTVAAALGSVAAGGLIGARVVVRDALERAVHTASHREPTVGDASDG